MYSFPPQAHPDREMERSQGTILCKLHRGERKVQSNWQSRNLCGSYYAISAVSVALDLMGETGRGSGSLEKFPRAYPALYNRFPSRGINRRLSTLHSPQSNIVLPTTENLIIHYTGRHWSRTALRSAVSQPGISHPTSHIPAEAQAAR
ncbi:predicted protein [Histoplasma capsulatum G186AR]|uniref:Uncharacterized protein n=1 Tax=Ajellomyces capsulatus (strain G186AR / H82 / ATCC MYA-2454 / RMSCC 2432) TaxID=447093 RepID=C0NZR1_AJECG|nr:uncharacterized protein HCBG_08641 [Histoplasma capsulatum G186AR]EEH03001.1 predicted protein [Histoplasma capsulatum G186AR]